MKTLFKVKSVKAVIGPTQRNALVSLGLTSELTNVWLAQNPPYTMLVSFGRK